MTIPPVVDSLLTIEDVARHLACSTRTVRRLLDEGELPVIRLNRLVRILPSDLDRYIRTHRSD